MFSTESELYVCSRSAERQLSVSWRKKSSVWRFPPRTLYSGAVQERTTIVPPEDLPQIMAFLEAWLQGDPATNCPIRLCRIHLLPIRHQGEQPLLAVSYVERGDLGSIVTVFLSRDSVESLVGLLRPLLPENGSPVPAFGL